MKLEFAVEPASKAVPEIIALLPEHWEEFEKQEDDMPMEPNFEVYAKLAAAGLLHIVTARDGGKLVGYHTSTIYPSMHCKSALTCFADMFYLKKEYRVGWEPYKMLKFFRDSVRAKGVHKIQAGTKLFMDMGKLLDRLGFKPTERIYTAVFHD